MTNNKLPVVWKNYKVVDICDVYQPKTISTKELLPNGQYYVYGANGKIGKYNKYNHKDSEILVTCRGATCGTINKSEPFSWINGNAMVVHPLTDSLSSDFLFYYLHSVNFKPYISGSAQPQITRISLQPLEIDLPPLAEQKRIVEKIEEIFAKIDAGVEKLKSAQEKIKQYKQSVLHSAFTGKLYKTTEWKELPLKDVCSINPKTEIPELKEEDIVAFLPMPAVDAETNKYNEVYASFKSVKKGFTKFQNKDVLFAKITPCMENGKSCVVDNLLYNIGFGSTEFHVLRCSENLLNKFIYFIISSVSFRKLAKIKMTGAVGQQRVPADFLKTFPISLPTFSEQERIVEEIEKKFTKADKMLDAVEKSLQLSEQLKQSVLKKAFEGRLVPQDPNDEPASVLLARIKSEKQQNEKAKGKRNDRK